MKHTSTALARLLLSISVVIILVSSVLPQFGFLSSSVEANHRTSELVNQLNQLHGTSQSSNSGSSAGSPIQSESGNIEPGSTSSDTTTDSTSQSSNSGSSAGSPIKSESGNIEPGSTSSDTTTDSTSQSSNSGSSGSPTQSESENIGPVSTSNDISTDGTSGSGSSNSYSYSNSSSGSGIPTEPDMSETATSSFLNNSVPIDSGSNTTYGGSSDGGTLPGGSSQAESGGSESSNGTSLEPDSTGSSPSPASEGSGSSASNSSSAGQPINSVSSTDQSLQLSNESSSVVGGGSSNQSSAEGNLTTTIGSSGTPASGPTGGNTTAASVSHPGELGVVADEAISVSSSSNPNAVEQTISTGSGQVVSYGNVNNVENVSATISLDKKSYNPGDSPIISLNDAEANVDPNQVNTIQVHVSSSSDKSGILLTLTETGANTGVFQGAFSFTSGDSSSSSGLIKVAAGDNIGISYVGSHPRMQADIGGIQQGGNVVMVEVPDPTDKPTTFIGGAVQLTFGDEVVLAPNAKTEEIITQCNDFGIPPSDCPSGVAAGETTITMSYANAPLNGQDPAAFTIWQNVPGTGWVDLSKYQPPGSVIQIDSDKHTVTAYTPFKGGVFVIGIPAAGGGGGGGGIGLPGAGIVLDLLAPVTAETPPPPPTTSPPTTTSPVSDNSNNTTTGSTVGQTTGTGQKNNEAGLGTTASSASQPNSPGSTSQSGAFDTVIPVPGIGNVTLSFSNIGSERSFVVSEVKSPEDLDALKIIKAPGGGANVLFTLDNTRYVVVGPAFNIGPIDAKINGTVTVTIPYNSTLAPQGGNSVRMFQFTGSGWEDVTTNPPADGHVVTGSLNGLGPVVAAIKSK